MKVSQLKSKIKSFYTRFIAPPKKWQTPRKSKILVYGACGIEVMLPYLKNYNVTIMAVRGEFINLPCFFLAMLKIDFWKGKLFNAYVETFICAVSPQIIITFVDNNPAFFEISKRFKDIKTIFIQNGTRGESGDIFEYLVKSESYHVDYILVHGKSIGLHYKNYISGQLISIGSLKNNSARKLTNVPNDYVLFISQWHPKPDNGIFYVEADGTPIYWDDFFEPESMVLAFIDKWCVKNNKHLKICGRCKDDDALEKFFYADRLINCAWDFIPNTNNYSAYKLIDAAEISVFIDSTLGYESLARGKKTAAFTCRGFSISSDAANFGWPQKLVENGPFWTNNQDQNQFKRIMDYLNSVDNDDWEKVCYHSINDIIEFDPDNSRLVTLLDKLVQN